MLFSSPPPPPPLFCLQVLAAKWNEPELLGGLLSLVEKNYSIPRATIFRYAKTRCMESYIFEINCTRLSLKT